MNTLALYTTIAVATTCFGATAAKIPEHPTKIAFPALNWKVPLGTPFRMVHDNGLISYIAEDQTLPFCRIIGYLRYGQILDPVGKEGLGALSAALIKAGGTQHIPADTLEMILEKYAIELDVRVTETEMVFSYKYLSEFSDTALSLLQQILFQPAFDKNRLSKERDILLEAVRHRFNNPGPTLSAAYRKALYARSANGRLVTAQSLRSITREDLLKLHQRVVRTENTILAVSGDFNKEKMVKQLGRLFPPSRSQRDSLTNTIAVNPQVRSLVVHQPITQAYVRIGTPLFTRPHPDYYAITILDQVLGGDGFTSRLGAKIRSDEGLTYSIYSQAESNYIFPSTFSITFHTKTETASRAIGLALAEVDRIRKEGITDQELESAKKVLIDGLPSMFRSPFDIVKTYAWNEYYGRPDSHYVVYPDAIRAISKDDVKRVAQSFLDPAKFTYVIVADTNRLFSVDSVTANAIRGLGTTKITLPDSLPRLW